MHDPARVARDDLLLVHTADYVERFTAGRLTPDGRAASRVSVVASRWSSGRTGRRAERARPRGTRSTHGIAMNLAGGTHHAFPDHGEGFCVFNDVAVAIRALQRDGRIRRAAVIDLDVHQGNGTHADLRRRRLACSRSACTAGETIPFHKVAGTLDVELADGTGDDEYLAALTSALPARAR